MANYTSLQAAIDAGITNMTVIRNNSKNDDSTDTIATGITWFYFNSVQVTNLYASGNSWIGLGVSSEQLKVNRRDAAVYYEYTETGTIGANRFFKLRWCGYSYYSQSGSAYAQNFDVFLFDNGQIFLNWFAVPTSSFDGINALVCGSTTTTFSATAGTAGEWTFTPTDATTGTGWSVSTGRPDIKVHHKTNGSAIFTTDTVQVITEYGTSVINWDENTPQGTTVTVYAACTVSAPTDADYKICENGGLLPCCEANADLSSSTLYIKAVLETTDDTQTPTISNMTVKMEDKKYSTYVSKPRSGVYKVYCDLSDKIHGITVLNKATSRLRFALGDSKMPVFSVHTFIKGLVSYDNTTCLYEKESFPAFSFRITESDTSNFWTAIDAGDISESTTFAFTHGTVTETTNILLT